MIFNALWLQTFQEWRTKKEGLRQGFALRDNRIEEVDTEKGAYLHLPQLLGSLKDPSQPHLTAKFTALKQ